MDVKHSLICITWNGAKRNELSVCFVGLGSFDLFLCIFFCSGLPLKKKEVN